MDGIMERYQGSESEVFIDTIGENKVTQIGTKAFLSCKSVKKLVLSDRIDRIGDWAFAHMQNLQLLELPCHEINLGRKVFLGCEALRQIRIRGDESGNQGTPFFMASAVRVLKNDVLCKPQEAGKKKNHEKWINAYDKSLFQFLEEPDEAGFEPVFIGWFHVEDTDEQLSRYLEKRRRDKTELVFQRLLYPAYLEEEKKKALYGYLREHMPKEEEQAVEKKEQATAFMLLCEPEGEYGKDIRYMKIMEQGGILTPELIRLLLREMPDASPEITAFLLRKQAQPQQKTDFFEELQL